jgi:hypothetical protein
MTRRRVRILSTGHGRKNDDADAVSVGIAARSARCVWGERPCQVPDTGTQTTVIN